jgi:hypothetical protein
VLPEWLGPHPSPVLPDPTAPVAVAVAPTVRGPDPARRVAAANRVSRQTMPT